MPWFLYGLVHNVSRLHQHAIFGDVSMSDMCRTPESLWLVGLWCSSSVSFYFYFCFASLTWLRRGSDTSSMPTVEKKNHRFWQMDLPIPLILWYTLKQKVETHISSSQPTLPLTFARCPLSLTGARSGQSASSIDVDAVPYPFRSLSLSQCGQ